MSASFTHPSAQEISDFLSHINGKNLSVASLPIPNEDAVHVRSRWKLHFQDQEDKFFIQENGLFAYRLQITGRDYTLVFHDEGAFNHFDFPSLHDGYARNIQQAARLWIKGKMHGHAIAELI